LGSAGCKVVMFASGDGMSIPRPSLEGPYPGAEEVKGSEESDERTCPMAVRLNENMCQSPTPRGDVDVLLRRAELLGREDRELLEAVFARGQTLVSIARMTGVSSRRVSNRLRRITRRLTSREFLDAARALGYLSREDAALASLRFCQGLSSRKMAAKLEMSAHVLRRRLDRISAQIEIIGRLQRGSTCQGAGPGQQRASWGAS